MISDKEFTTVLPIHINSYVFIHGLLFRVIMLIIINELTYEADETNDKMKHLNDVSTWDPPVNKLQWICNIRNTL